MFARRSIIGNAFRVVQKLQIGASTSASRNIISSSKFASSAITQSSKSSSILNRFPQSSVALSEVRSYSTTKEAESTLVDFLKEEIEAEKKLAKQQQSGSSAKQPDVPGFQVKSDQREVVLSKQHGSEKITVTFDVNHTVDSDAGEPTTRSAESPSGKAPPQSTEQAETPQMISKPSFTVEIAKGEQKLVFECSFVEPDFSNEGGTEEYADLFNIEEIYTYTGESLDDKNKIYAVSGGIIDGTLYDHMMNYLEERGIDNDFAQNLTRYATYYEHEQYVSLLQKIRDFVAH